MSTQQAPMHCFLLGITREVEGDPNSVMDGLESSRSHTVPHHPLTEIANGTLPSKWHLQFLCTLKKMQVYAAPVDIHTPQSIPLILITNT